MGLTHPFLVALKSLLTESLTTVSTTLTAPNLPQIFQWSVNNRKYSIECAVLSWLYHGNHHPSPLPFRSGCAASH
ncbi:hypothetical protein M752DRAFT_54315 [Aspergillus phoenicis ATCC 13157]|uniref:Uncharacterized protein n=1 Tax=Aspergillus phoenicis ATCC 13157 TaxID=1353007 RepID=A0A370PBP3_ASPPH|nr:hypothetical protein M752DRAFT_54315 [Aspergillus phoenicis ATCC 13157]